MKPYLIEGVVWQLRHDEGEESARAAYGANYDRLVTLKDKYDPTNFFRMNHNIKPSQAAPAASD